MILTGNSVQEIAGWLLLIFCIRLLYTIKFYTFHYRYRCLKNVIHQIDSRNGWLLLSASLRQNLGQFLSQHWKTLFLRGFIFKGTERVQVLKNGTRDFQNSPPLERSACFDVTISEKLKQIFQKTKTFSKKLEYCFLVERIKIEKSSFPYKTAISKTNVKINRVVTTKWDYHRELSFASNYFIFF